MKIKRLLVAVMVLIVFAGLLPIRVFAGGGQYTGRFQWDLSGGYPNDFDPLTPMSSLYANEGETRVLPSMYTGNTTDENGRGGVWTFIWTPKDADGAEIPVYVNANGDETFTMPASDVTIYGRWRFTPNKYKVTFQIDLSSGYPDDFDPSSSFPPIDVAEADSYTLPPKPTTGKTTRGSSEGAWEFIWTSAKDADGADVINMNGGVYTFTMPASGVTVHGGWSFTPNKHIVTFVLDGGSMSSPSEVEVNDGDTVSRPSDAPSRGDKEYFYDWYADDAFTAKFAFDSAIKQETKLYARYISDYAISYELNGGVNDPANPATYTVVSPAITLKDPTWDGHIFVGWYDNASFSGSPITEIPANSTEDKTFYAKWKKATATPETGDERPLALWSGALLLSFAAMIVLLVRARKQRVQE